MKSGHNQISRAHTHTYAHVCVSCAGACSKRKHNSFPLLRLSRASRFEPLPSITISPFLHCLIPSSFSLPSSLTKFSFFLFIHLNSFILIFASFFFLTKSALTSFTFALTNNSLTVLTSLSGRASVS